jgi:glycosyltransferase involved in cell wall biosynthesis
MRVSIVIPACNAAATIGACVQACLAQTHAPAEVIVVDDGSTDATAALAERAGARCIRQQNAGPAAARNRGANEAVGELVAFTDSDCIPRPDWLAALLTGFAHDGVWAVGGTYGIANPHSRLARVVHAEIMARHARFAEEVDFLGSFNVAYRRERFLDVGGFDTGFTQASGEDNDLAYRLQDAGGVLRFARDAVVAHYHPEHLGRYLRTQARHGYWRMKLYAKHRGRARTGDRYAGIGELLGVPWSLALVGLLPGAMVSVALGPVWVGAVYAALWIPLLAGYTLRALRLPAVSAKDRLCYMDMAFLRDIARGAGMLRGVCHFAARGQA